MKRLYYFTDSYPFSVDYTWKTAEINEASKQFDEVIIVPFTLKRDNVFTFAKNVRIEKVTLGNTLFAKPKYIKHLFSASQPQSWFSEFFKALNRGKLAVIDWYLATVYSNIILGSNAFKRLKSEADHQQGSVLFFQWTMNNALLVPLLHRWGYRNIICRMHGFDLYEFRHNNYLPYKSSILKFAKTCTFISEHGRNYATDLYPIIKEKSYTHYLGAIAMEKNKLETNQVFHIVSISRVVPLKRLELIVESLKLLDFPIKWTHIGDGHAMNLLENHVNLLNVSNKYCDVKLLGWLNPNEIKEFFSINGINAMLLVSETEGLPVVIMEAFSASIPVIATDVGGVSELVNSTNGVLLSQNPEPSEISEAIQFLYNEPTELMQYRRKAAFLSFQNKFDLEKNSKKFINFLEEQCH